VDAICERPNRHLFWDGIHPTAAGHGIVEDAAQQALHAMHRPPVGEAR
jgi:phospholipase/lecithinase/hemolysin